LLPKDVGIANELTAIARTKTKITNNLFFIIASPYFVSYLIIMQKQCQKHKKQNR
jgi:hypothetical protein